MCTFAAVVIMAGGASYFWKTHDVNLTTGETHPVTTPVDWPSVLATAVTQAGVGALVLLVPWPLGLAAARRVYDWSHTSQLNLP